jgi:hypothetical protein
MEKRKSYIGKIDASFDFLLMGRTILGDIIPDSDSEKAIELACTLVAQLIKSAVDELQSAPHSVISTTDKLRLASGLIQSEDVRHSSSKAPLVDVDERIGARLRELMAVS